MSLGLYVSVPFCRTKCSYCNFASDVFSRSVFQRYLERVCADMKRVNPTLAQMGGRVERFVAISEDFEIRPNAEITVECAPGTLTSAVIETLQSCGVNRVSLGVQSFIDKEAASVARLHTREKTL